MSTVDFRMHSHEWRHYRTWTTTEVLPLQPPGNYTTHVVTWHEWYCVFCRTFNTTRMPA